MTIDKRWALVSRGSGERLASFNTRDAARFNKRAGERIFDNVKGVYVR